MGSAERALPPGAGWDLGETGSVGAKQGLREFIGSSVIHRLCSFVCLFLIYVHFHPQALDDANKGIISELKKTNYRDLFKEKRERGEFLEPGTAAPEFPSTLPPSSQGWAPTARCSDFCASGSPSPSLGRDREAIQPTVGWGLPREPTPVFH